MGVAALAKELGLKMPWERLQQAPTQQPPVSLGASAAKLVKSIRDGTITVEQIDSFLQKAQQITADQKEYLLAKKGSLLCQLGRLEEGLRYYDQAFEAKETPSTWAIKGTALLQLERLDEAFQAFQRAYLLRENFGPQKQGYLEDLFAVWSGAALLRGLLGILDQDFREAQKAADEYLNALDKAKGEGLEGAVVGKVVAQQPIPQENQEALEEWELMVRLLSIKNPFDGFRALAKEVSKVWPKDVSAVDAIREQRDREWNR